MACPWHCHGTRTLPFLALPCQVARVSLPRTAPMFSLLPMCYCCVLCVGCLVALAPGLPFPPLSCPARPARALPCHVTGLACALRPGTERSITVAWRVIAVPAPSPYVLSCHCPLPCLVICYAIACLCMCGALALPGMPP